MIYTVYEIKHNDIVIYIGHTKNIKQRSYAHNYNIPKLNNSLYKYCREQGIDKLELIPLREFKSKVEAKRYECYLILDNHFNGDIKNLNKIPNISDR